MLKGTFFFIICITYKQWKCLGGGDLKGYKSLFNKVESILLSICLICIVVLIGLQLVINNNDLSTYIAGVDNLEEELNKTVSEEIGVIILKLEDAKYTDVEVLINGEVYDEKFKENGEIRLNVYANDVIEINGTKYDNSVIVKIDGISKNIMQPELNTVITTNKTIELIGKVILK